MILTGRMPFRVSASFNDAFWIGEEMSYRRLVPVRDDSLMPNHDRIIVSTILNRFSALRACG
jgi:hypothetical protein